MHPVTVLSHLLGRGGALKTQVGLLENASTEKASTKQRISQGWKTHVGYGKRKYESAGMENASTENTSTMQTFSQIKKFGTSQVSVVHFQVGWASGLQIGFSKIT